MVALTKAPQKSQPVNRRLWPSCSLTPRSTIQRWCYTLAHDAFAHAVRPCHTIFDGDITFSVGLREGNVAPAEAISIAMATELAVEQAIMDAVTA